jgi:hypothetical protein
VEPREREREREKEQPTAIERSLGAVEERRMRSGEDGGPYTGPSIVRPW